VDEKETFEMENMGRTKSGNHHNEIRQGLSIHTEMCLIHGYMYPATHYSILADQIHCPSTSFQVRFGEDAKGFMSQLYASMSMQEGAPNSKQRKI
jgi:hypothetical protein